MIGSFTFITIFHYILICGLLKKSTFIIKKNLFSINTKMGGGQSILYAEPITEKKEG